MSEPLGKAEVEIRADSSKLGGDLDGAEKKTKAFTKQLQRGIGDVLGPAAASVAVVAAVKKVDDAYRAFIDSSRQLSEAQRSLTESFVGGSVTAGLSAYEEGIVRINKAWDEHQRRLEDIEASRDIFTRVAESLTGGSELEVMRQAGETAMRQAKGAAEAREKNRQDLEREKQLLKEREQAAKRYEDQQKRIADVLEKINEEAAEAGLSEAEKIERERMRRIDQIGAYENDVGRAVTEEAIANINKIYDAKQRKRAEDEAKEQERMRKEQEQEQKKIEAFSNAMTDAFRSAEEAAFKAFNAADLNVHFTRMRELLSLIANQRSP